NNGRVLILPWVRVKGLASKILALSARRMPRAWQTRYGHRPLLLETLVDAQRFRGTCYRAANWIPKIEALAAQLPRPLLFHLDPFSASQASQLVHSAAGIPKPRRTSPSPSSRGCGVRAPPLLHNY